MSVMSGRVKLPNVEGAIRAVCSRKVNTGARPRKLTRPCNAKRDTNYFLCSRMFGTGDARATRGALMRPTAESKRGFSMLA